MRTGLAVGALTAALGGRGAPAGDGSLPRVDRGRAVTSIAAERGGRVIDWRDGFP